MVDPLGAWSLGLWLKTLSSGPTWLTLTEKPRSSRRCVARSTGSPSTLGTATMGGPGEIVMVMTWPLVNALPGGSDWSVTVPAGASLLAAVRTSSDTPLADAHPWAASCGCPTRLGIGGPALTTSRTGCGCGHMTPATGVVPTTMPAAMVPDVSFVTGPGVSPAWRSAACAACRVSPVTCGIRRRWGPADGISVIWLPLPTRCPLVGTERITWPLANWLSSFAVPMVTVNPAPRSSAAAAAVVMPVTLGTVVYRPEVIHHVTTPTTRSAATAAAR